MSKTTRKTVSKGETISVRRIGTVKGLMFRKTGQKSTRFHEFGKLVPLYVTKDGKHLVIPARFVRGQIEG